jgi:hypothetical protein
VIQVVEMPTGRDEEGRLTKLSQNVNRRWAQARGMRGQWEPVWEELQRLFDPFRGDIITQRPPGSRRIGTVFDPTGSISAERFSNFMHAAVFPADGDWLRMTTRAFQREYNQELNLALFATSRRMMAALQESNFYSVTSEFLKQLVVLCTSVLFWEEKPPRPYRMDRGTFGGLAFKHCHLGNVWLEQGRLGEVTGIFMREMIPAVDAFEQFGANAGPQVMNALERDPTQQFTYVHAVYPRADKIAFSPAVRGEKAWACVTLGVDTGHTGSAIVYEGGYDFKPFVSPRWEVVEGQIYGVGPGYQARAGGAGGNEILRQILMAIPMEYRPMLMLEHEGIMKANYVPGGHLIMKRNTAMKPEFLKSGANFEATEKIRNEIQAGVAKAFYADQTELPMSDRMTAEEIITRRQIALTHLVLPNMKISHEFLKPLVENVEQLMLAAGALPELAEAQQHVGKIDREYRFLSPMARAQRKASLAPAREYVNEKIQQFQVVQDPAILDSVDWDGLDRLITRDGDVPPEVVTSQDIRDQRRKQRGKAQQAQQIQQAAMAAAQVSKDAPGMAKSMGIPVEGAE